MGTPMAALFCVCGSVFVYCVVSHAICKFLFSSEASNSGLSLPLLIVTEGSLLIPSYCSSKIFFKVNS